MLKDKIKEYLEQNVYSFLVNKSYVDIEGKAQDMADIAEDYTTKKLLEATKIQSEIMIEIRKENVELKKQVEILEKTNDDIHHDLNVANKAYWELKKLLDKDRVVEICCRHINPESYFLQIQQIANEIIKEGEK